MGSISLTQWAIKYKGRLDVGKGWRGGEVDLEGVRRSGVNMMEIQCIKFSKNNKVILLKR